MVVGLGGCNTGNGIFTLKAIPVDTWITSYAPFAPIRRGSNHPHSDYIIKTIRNQTEVEIDGSLCPLGIGKIIQDGTFPFCLAPEKFSSLIKARTNCAISDREGEIWMKSTRTILAGEELLTKYSHDSSYWYLQFSSAQIQAIRQALLTSPSASLSDAQAIIKDFQFSTTI